MRPPRRLEAHPLTRIDRGEAIEFHHEGQRVPAFRGEPVAVALYAAGRPVLSRSMRYHRARGLFCGTGQCTHCFLRVDGVPNVRSCQTPCEPTTWSEGQNAFPSVEHDALAAADLAYPRYLDAHSAFARPRWLRRIYLPIVRQMAGFGTVPREPVSQSFRREAVETEVLVVGAGPAGLAAADAAAGGGARVTLVDQGAQAGGRLQHLPTPFHGAVHEHAPRLDGKRYAEEATAALRSRGVDLRTGARLFGVYDGTWSLVTRTSLVTVRPQRVVVAVGSEDAYDPFPGSDRAGVLLATAASRLLNLHGVLPADPVIVYGATREGLLLARDLVACGARVKGVYDPRPAPPAPEPLLEDARRLGIAVQVGHRIAFVAGRKSPRAVVFDTPAGRVRVPCATLAVAMGRVALGQVFQQAGAALRPDPLRGGFVPEVGHTLETTVQGLYAAGSCLSADDEWGSVLAGRVAGAAAACSLRPEDGERRRRLDAALDGYTPAPEARP